ncbi:hypothetical protein J7337_012712 [Fusarium musae]|uniref:Carboxyphosphonoenolpyruvate phosphonomutase-like protein n=1 Tax=Fusarium musae TaxID=1042133 RepID=A0A9P8IKI2_9HYPO|nr:hypothetical protein J7337_012712 [Fusarium musae]KAG9496133.1 hypothetical protein J7337_012712 [Fusarium musae]
MGSNCFAQTLKSLHIPSQPLIFANVWDLASLNLVLSLNSETSKPVKATATASWAFAASPGVEDEELTMEQNLASIRNLAARATSAGLPLSVDLQDGYGFRLREAVTQALQAGAHGANIEDSIPARAPADAGLPDFVINARCDVFALKDVANLNHETRMKESVRRGKAYFDAGATTVFFWRGYGAGFTEADVQTLVKELDGHVAIRLGQTPEALSVSQLAKSGVTRIGIGPSLFQMAMDAAKRSALNFLEGGRLGEL